MKKVFKIGCLSIVGFFVLLFIYGLLEPDSWKEARIKSFERDRDSAQYYVNEVTIRMVRVSKLLPRLTHETSSIPFPAGPIDWSRTLQTSEEEVNRFTDNGFVLSPPLYWGPWLSEVLHTIEENYDTSKVKDPYKTIRAGKKIIGMKYLMVYVPLFHQQPAIVDKKTFQPGYFDGWMIYVDFINGQPLGYARFQSFSTLYKVSSEKFGVGVGPLSIPLVSTTNVQDELTEDFRNEFFRKTDSTFLANKQLD